MQRLTLRNAVSTVTLATMLTVPAAFAQSREVKNDIRQGQLTQIQQSEQEVRLAEQAGARTLAPTLFSDAEGRLRSAQSLWNDKKSSNRDTASLQSEQAFWAARAARAKSQWLGNVGTARNLQTDIRRFGGTSDLTMVDEPMMNDINRGTSSKMRIAYAQRILDEAKAAGAEQLPNNDLRPAQDNLNTARKIVSNNNTSASADHLAYVAEMMARRAYYMTRVMDTNKYLPNLQLERTRLAQAASEQAAAAERRQREESERRAADLQAQLQAEAANRQAQQSELDSLRAQLAESQRMLAARVDEDRAARARAEAALDQAYATYQSALAGGTASSDVDTMRRQLEDQQIALRAVQERERLNEQAMSTEIDRLRADLSRQQTSGADAQALADRQAELTRRQEQLETMRGERERDVAARAEVERQQQSALAEAQRRREEAEVQANLARQQTTTAQAAAQQAQLLAQQAQSQAQSAQAELGRTREQLADKDAQLQRRELQSQLTRIVTTTRSEDRGIVVTLGGTYFDTGKTTLKAGGKATLDRIAASLVSNASAHVLVEGHTDNVGSTESNLRLSEQRAAAVRDYLVSKGVPEDRITSAGKGEAAPVTTNKTPAGRQQNRRVELVISM